MLGNFLRVKRTLTAKNGRNRFLNVVYFLDASRTRSFKLSLSKLNAILGFLAVILIWSVWSLFLLSSLRAEKEDLSARLSDALKTVFDYQTKYDGVFEKAYPEKVSKEDQEEDPRPPAAKSPAPSPLLEKSQMAEASPSMGDGRTQTRDKMLAFENPVFEQNAGIMEMAFAIRNNDSDNKAEGFMWGVASYKREDGKTAFVSAPTSIEIDESGHPAQPGKAYRYSIRSYGPKKFTFKMVPGESGKFTKVKVVLLDNKLTERAVFELPIGDDGDIGKKKKIDGDAPG